MQTRLFDKPKTVSEEVDPDYFARESTAAELAARQRIREEMLAQGWVQIDPPAKTPRPKANYKRDNKSSRAGDVYKAQGSDACLTPPYALDPLLPYLERHWTIWEPACGENLLVEAFYDSGFDSVIGTDLLTGQNFFEHDPGQWDCLITNPPYSIKYKWLRRCYELGQPFALLLPVETLGAKTAQKLIQQYGFEIMLLDSRVDFRMPNKGWDGTAQFPVFWLCWKVLPEKIMFGSIRAAKKAFKEVKHENKNTDTKY